MNKIFILFVLIALTINGCASLKFEPIVQKTFPDLRFCMQSSEKGEFLQTDNAEKVKFQVDSKSLYWNDTPIFFNTAPQKIVKNESFLFFEYSQNYLSFSNFAFVEALLNPNKYRKNIQVIVLDAGHGGKDPGAVGKKSLEKDLNLNIVLALKSYLEGQGKRVYLTRSSDEYLALSERIDIVKSLPEKVDLFISIHQNASTNPQANGVEIYFPAKIFENSNVREDDKFNFLLACDIQNNLTKNLKVKNRGVKFANFYVLKNNPIPAVLIECGFISNLQEEEIISSPEYISKFIESLAKAL